MNEEYNNINGMGSDPESNTENQNAENRNAEERNIEERNIENRNADSQNPKNVYERTAQAEAAGTSFVMRDTVEEKTENKEPGKAPTPENPYYAHSYRKEPESREPYTSYRFTSQIPQEPEQKKQRKSGGTAKKFGMVVAAAVVFGLVAGGTFQAVNYAAGKFMPKETKQIENTQITQEPVKETSSDSVSIQSGGTVSEVAKNVMPSVVSITGMSVQEIPNYFGFGVQQYETPSSGSGIIVGQNEEELLIATNNHVVKGTKSITVCFTNQDGTAVSAGKMENTGTDEYDNSKELEQGTAVAAQIKGTDADNDLAVVAVKISDIPEDVLAQIKVASIGDSNSLIIGEQVVAIGNALGYGQSVTSGYVSALNKQVNSEDVNSTFIQTDAAINPGNSGGALLNMRGELVGINSAKIAASEVEGMGFAIPISRAEPILDDLMSKKTRSKVDDENKAAYIGITCKNVTEDASQMFNMPVGIFVDSVVEDGPAASSGLQTGDIIRKIDGTSVQTYENLIGQLEYYEAGEEIEFVISRADNGEYKEQIITVKLGAKKDARTVTENGRSKR